MSIFGGLRGYASAWRATHLVGQASALKESGRLEEALAICARAVEAAGPIGKGARPSSLGTLIVATLTFDEIAAKLGRRQLALEPLASTLSALERFKQTAPAAGHDIIDGYERQIQERLAAVRLGG